MIESNCSRNVHTYHDSSVHSLFSSVHSLFSSASSVHSLLFLNNTISSRDLMTIIIMNEQHSKHIFNLFSFSAFYYFLSLFTLSSLSPLSLHPLNELKGEQNIYFVRIKLCISILIFHVFEMKKKEKVGKHGSRYYIMMKKGPE